MLGRGLSFGNSPPLPGSNCRAVEEVEKYAATSCKMSRHTSRFPKRDGMRNVAGDADGLPKAPYV
eukprot:11480688-Heterocapsa_arctica.AAC.1